MTTNSSPPHELLRRFGSLPVPPDDPARADAMRKKVVDHVAVVVRQEHRRNARRQSLRPAMFAALLAAAVVSLIIGWRLVRGRTGQAETSIDQMTAISGAVSVLRLGESIHPGEASLALRNEDEVRTAQDGQARLSLAQGTSVTVFPGSQVRLAPSTPQSSAIDLRVGRVEVHVPRLGPAGTFSVLTPHAQIVVHGTRFVVEVQARRADGVAPTSVRVIEGRVAVRAVDREVMLEAGAAWSNETQTVSAAAATEVPAPPPPSVASPSASPSARAVANTNAGVDAGASGPGSTLSEENRIFRAAMDARRRGNDAEAIRHLDALLGRYPNSTLAQEARVERFRCLRRLGQDAAAAGEARRYLAEHPDGFARDEARGMALPPSPSSSR